LVAYPHEPMQVALRRLGTRDISRLPVVEEYGSRHLLGVVRRQDIVRAYNFAVVRRAHSQYETAVQLAQPLEGATFEHIEIPVDSPVIGRRVSEINLPETCLVVSVLRGDELHVVRGATVLRAGDRVTIFSNEDCMPLVRQCLIGDEKEEQ
jgi:CIC family chloride channel protein